MEKIKRLFLYAGANPEEFAQGQQEMHDYNYGRLSVFLALAIVFLFSDYKYCLAHFSASATILCISKY